MTIYSDQGITQAQYDDALAGPWKKTAHRIKILSPGGQRTPDVTTTNITKIDEDGSSEAGFLHLTDSGKYMKVIHDEPQRRTLILHNATDTNTTDAVVSVINHDLETDDPDYVEKINKDTTTGWPTGHLGLVYDMAYDPTQQLLAIGVNGNNTDGPQLWVVNLNKYTDELLPGSCSEAAESDDYLDVKAWYAGEGYVGRDSGGIPMFVEFHKFPTHPGRFYVWHKLQTFIGSEEFYQLGHYYGDADGLNSYTLLYQTGLSPIRIPAGPLAIFNAAVTWPNSQPRWQEPTLQAAGLYSGDSARQYKEVISMRITDDGILCLGTEPSNNDQNGYGQEATASRFDLSIYDNEVETTVGLTSITLTPTLSGGTYTLLAGTDLSSHIDISGAKGMVAVEAVSSATGSAIGAYNSGGDVILMENEYGTTRMSGDRPDAVVSPEKVEYNITAFTYKDGSVVFGWQHGGFVSAIAFTLNLQINIKKSSTTDKLSPIGLEDTIGVHTVGAPIIQSGDTTTPSTGPWTDAYGAIWNLAERHFPAGDALWTRMVDCFYAGRDIQQWVLAVADQSSTFGAGLGLWAMKSDNDNYALTKYTNSGDLQYPHVVNFAEINGNSLIVLSDDDTGAGNTGNVAIQFWKIDTQEFTPADTFDFAPTYAGAIFSRNVIYDPKLSMIVFCGGTDGGNNSEVWIWQPEFTGGTWDRDPRRWWDGSMPDGILGDPDLAFDVLGQVATFNGLSFSQSRGSTSNNLSFNLVGGEYLPWNESVFNSTSSFEGDYDGLLQDGARLLLQSGLWENGAWTWIDEGQTFIDSSPANASDGFAGISVGSKGVIGSFVTKSIHTGYYTPTLTRVTDGVMSSSDSITYHYNGGSGAVDDWAASPAPIISVDGDTNTAYTLSLSSGEVVFGVSQGAAVVTATFSAYDSGTNEVEDIIECILIQENELGGAGLDDSYFTRVVTGETCSAITLLTWQAPITNIVDDSDLTIVYDNGVAQTEGVDFTWNTARAGVIDFTISGAPTTPVTIDAKYKTLAPTGITLKPIQFGVREQQSSYDCINQTLQAAGLPEFLLWEARDGKIHLERITQKTAANADIIVAATDIILNALTNNPMYEGIATRIISLGEAELIELENFCLAKTVTDLLTATGDAPPSWAAQLPDITDGNSATGVATGWGHAWSGDGQSIIDALIAAEPDGIPVFSIDMTAQQEVQTVVLSRVAQTADLKSTQTMSIEASVDGADWFNIANPFSLASGANISFEAGTDTQWISGSKFRYIKVILHSIDTYTNRDGPTDTQISFGEVQCFPHKTIIGQAQLQNADPDEPYYDEWGLLDKYGFITRVARGGQPDPNLRSVEQADADAGFTLMELARLMFQVDTSLKYLPGIPMNSTIAISSPTLSRDDIVFLVENRTIGDDEYSASGANFP